MERTKATSDIHSQIVHALLVAKDHDMDTNDAAEAVMQTLAINGYRVIKV